MRGSLPEENRTKEKEPQLITRPPTIPSASRRADYEAAIRGFDYYDKIESDPRFKAALVRIKNATWSWRAARAIAFAKLGQDQEALATYQNAREVKVQSARINEDAFGSDHVSMNEAEAVLRENGILRP